MGPRCSTFSHRIVVCLGEPIKLPSFVEEETHRFRSFYYGNLFQYCKKVVNASHFSIRIDSICVCLTLYLYIVLSLHAFNNHMCYIKTQQQHKNSTRLQSVSLRCVWDFLRSLTHPPPSSASTRCPLPLCCVVFHML